ARIAAKRKAWHRRCRRRGHIRWSRVRPLGIPTQRLLTRQASTKKRQRQTRQESVPSGPPQALGPVLRATLPVGFILRIEGVRSHCIYSEKTVRTRGQS